MKSKRLSTRFKLKLLALAALCYALLHFTRLVDYFHQKNYFTDFSYPSQVPNLSRLIVQLRAHAVPEVPPSNPFRFRLLLNCPSKCAAEVRVLLVVKSDVRNLANRMAIRQTWGAESGATRTLFLVAVPTQGGAAAEDRVRQEQDLHGDLVQGEFADRYHNNTWKTIMGLKWVRDHCPGAGFVLFVDDDFYVSPKNLMRLIRHPKTYPLEEEKDQDKEEMEEEKDQDKEDMEEDLQELSQRHWYTGHLFFVLPVRFTFHKFFVSLEEYPYVNLQVMQS